MTLKTIHNTFTKGELDPTLLARVDIGIYTKGARKLRNMVALWTGAARIAPGTTYTDVIPIPFRQFASSGDRGFLASAVVPSGGFGASATVSFIEIVKPAFFRHS